MNEEMIKYLVDNLEIEVDTVTEFGPVDNIVVTLKLNGHVISQDSCELPLNYHTD
jgi:hypothetical protein